MTQQQRPSIWKLPGTRLGKWSFGLAMGFVVLFLINTFVFMPSSGDTSGWLREVFLPIFGISMILCGLAAGVTGLLAVLRYKERSWTIWLPVLLGVLILFFLLGEFLIPH